MFAFICSYAQNDEDCELKTRDNAIDFDSIKAFIPLWYNLGCLEDLYFIGNATINDSLTISEHKVLKIRSGSVYLENLKFTTVTYDEKECTAIIDGMVGMLDYRKIYTLLGTDSFPVDSIKTTYINEPWMQLHSNGEVKGKEHDYCIIQEDDSTFVGDYKYIISTPNHIACGHEEFFFESGLAVKFISHGKIYEYKYKKLDAYGNWTLRDVFLNGVKQRSEERKIQYNYE